MLLRDRGDADAAAHLREGTKRWFVTARDATKRDGVVADRHHESHEARGRRRGARADARVHRPRAPRRRRARTREPRPRGVGVARRLRRARSARRAACVSRGRRHAARRRRLGRRRARVQALERRVAGDADALEAARTRETYLAEKLRGAETAKLGAFAAAHRAREELKAHVTRLRVDTELRREAQARLESNDADARELPVVKQQLLFARSELERLREADETREAIQSRAVADAVAQALRTRHDEAHAENLRLREALRVARTERGEADWEHARARASPPRRSASPP